MKYSKIAIVAADGAEAQQALEGLNARYDTVPVDDADAVVALGGDGFMIFSLHESMQRGLPIYGMNRGSVGFLMNEYLEDGLLERLEKAEPVTIRPLRMSATDVAGAEHEALAVNEVSLLRETRQAAHLKIDVDGRERMAELVCDGALVATAAGSTAYNMSAHGPILPMNAGLLALTPISAFRPRRWRGALLPETSAVDFEVIEADVRAVSATADYTEIRDVARVTVRQATDVTATLLFDPEHDLEERIIGEQFLP